MADYLVEGNKSVYCSNGHQNMVPFNQTTIKCTACGSTFFVEFYGVVIDKNGNYVY